MNDATIVENARAHRRTPVQVALRWLVQRGVGAIPKTARRDHLIENFGIFDFELTADELAAIGELAFGDRLVDPAWSPAWD